MARSSVVYGNKFWLCFKDFGDEAHWCAALHHKTSFYPSSLKCCLWISVFFLLLSLVPQHIVKSVTQLLIYCTLLNWEHCDVVIHNTQKCYLKVVVFYALLLVVLQFSRCLEWSEREKQFPMHWNFIHLISFVLMASKRTKKKNRIE